MEDTSYDHEQNRMQETKPVSKRLDPVTGKYNMKPLDSQYFNKYYHKHNVPTTCTFCGKTVGKMKMQRHLSTNRCMSFQNSAAWANDVESSRKYKLEELRDMFSEFLRQHPILISEV